MCSSRRVVPYPHYDARLEIGAILFVIVYLCEVVLVMVCTATDRLWWAVITLCIMKAEAYIVWRHVLPVLLGDDDSHDGGWQRIPMSP